MLLKSLRDALASNITKNLQSSFRIMGLHPFDPVPVLEQLLVDCSQETILALYSSLLEFLKDTRGFNTERIRHRRGKKFVHQPGISVTSQYVLTIDDAPEIENDITVVETVPAIEDDLTLASTTSISAALLAKDQTSSNESVALSD